jgi:3-oxoadipate enol-lactonase
VVTKVANLPSRSTRYLESPGDYDEGLVRGTRTLILLHAFPLSADQWLPQLARVPQGWRFIAPDIRGFRGVGPAFQDAGLEDATIDDYADDVLTLMDHLDIERAAVCGLSMGGYVAMAMFARASSRISSLILADTRMTPDSAEARDGRDLMRAKVAAGGPPVIAKEMLPKLLGKTTKREQPDLVDVVCHMIEVNRTAAIAGAIGALKTRVDRAADLGRVKVPTLILCGAEDVITPPAESEAMALAIHKATVEIIPEAGHLSNLEQPLLFNAALHRFLV